MREKAARREGDDRKCSKCKKTKSHLEFKRFATTETTRGWRFHPWCRACFQAHDRKNSYQRTLRFRARMKARSLTGE